MSDHNYFANLIWQIADLLRGPYPRALHRRYVRPLNGGPKIDQPRQVPFVQTLAKP
jgi:hypothetical protein